MQKKHSKLKQNGNFQKTSFSNRQDLISNSSRTPSSYTKISKELLEKSLHQIGRKTNPLGLSKQQKPDSIVFHHQRMITKEKFKQSESKRNQSQQAIRLASEAEKLQQKKEELKNEYEEKYMKECTFSPNIGIETTKRNQQKLLADLKLADEKQARNLLQLRDESLKQSQLQHSFQPNLERNLKQQTTTQTQNSKTFSYPLVLSLSTLKSPSFQANNQTSESMISCHDRLYSDALQKLTKSKLIQQQEDQFLDSRNQLRFFSPQQTQPIIIAKQRKKSPILSCQFDRSYEETRKGNVHEFLYCDAKSQLKKKKQLYQYFQNKKKQQYNDLNSKQYQQEKQLAKQLLRSCKNCAMEVFELNNSDNIIALSNMQKVNRKLNYQQIQLIFIKMGFFQGQELKQGEKSEQQNFFQQSSLFEDRESQEITIEQQNETIVEIPYKELDKIYEQLQLKLSDCLHIKILCIIIFLIMGIKINTNIIQLVHSEFPPESFTEPESLQLLSLTNQNKKIKQILQQLSSHRLHSSNSRAVSPSQSTIPSRFLNLSNDELKTHSNYLFNESKVKATKLSQQRELKQQEEDSLCTFHPEVHNKNFTEGLTQRYLTEKHIRYSVREEKESDLSECTFMPSFISQQRKAMIKQESIRQTEINHIQKQKQQIEKARTVRQYLQRAFERSPEIIPKNPLTKQFHKKNQKNKKQEQQKNEKENKVSNAFQPISIAEVHLSPTESQKIYIYSGDKSSELAAKFANQYSLDEKMKGKLEKMLEQKILQNL